MDENEGQYSNYCLRDSLRSAGPDQIWGTSDDISLLNIPFHDIEQCGA